MSRTSLWVILLGMGVITFLLRASFILLSNRIHLPEVLERALKFVPAAVLSAIVVPALLYWQGELDLSVSNERLLAGGLAMLVAWRTQSILLTITVGMLTLWGLQLLLP